MKILEKIFEDPRTVKTLKRVLCGLMALVVVLDVFIHRHHEYFFWDRIPGFNAFFGLLSCVAIIFIAIAVGTLLQKKEDFYD